MKAYEVVFRLEEYHEISKALILVREEDVTQLHEMLVCHFRQHSKVLRELISMKKVHHPVISLIPTEAK